MSLDGSDIVAKYNPKGQRPYCPPIAEGTNCWEYVEGKRKWIKAPDVCFSFPTEDEKKMERPMGYRSSHDNVDQNTQIARKIFDAMHGLGTDKCAMEEAFKEINKYNVVEVLDLYKTFNGQDMFSMIKDDFSIYGKSDNPLCDDCAFFE